MGFDHFRIGHAGALFHSHPKRAIANPTCAKGGFYKSPTVGQTINSLEPLNITWDTTCLNSSTVDLYLYAPGSNRSRIHVWEGVEFFKGSYNATLNPGWWNSTSSMSLQITIIDSGTPPFLSTLPAGPVFTATYTVPPGGAPPQTTQSDNGITQVNNVASNTEQSLAPGKTAAAVIMPLLIVALVIGIYLKISRARGKEKRKRWSEAVDKRMSTISTDWKSMSGAGANAAIRNSIAVSGNSGNRNSAFSFGAIRPSSSFTVDGGQAGIGAAARGMYTHDNSSIDTTASRQMSQIRPGARTSAFGERVSRVSFAADPRPSGESRRAANGASRAFHSAYIPPLPTRQDSHDDLDDDSGSGAMSPTQTQGPLNLTSEDIRERISGNSNSTNAGMDEVMPALSMMRTGRSDALSPAHDNDDFLFAPTPPSPTHLKAPKSPVGMMPMQPMPANVMSPDEMLRAYAERRPTTPITNSFGAGISYPIPAANNYNGNGMRTLYSPTTPTSAAPMIRAGPGAALAGDRKSLATTFGSAYSIATDEDDVHAQGAYMGTAE